jgi:hypothetical protein
MLGADRNICPSSVTDHPAISLPYWMEDGRPIAMMLVGHHPMSARSIVRTRKTPRICRLFRMFGRLTRRDRTAWLGREQTNSE